MDGWIVGNMVGWMNGWIDGWMDRWMHTTTTTTFTTITTTSSTTTTIFTTTTTTTTTSLQGPKEYTQYDELSTDYSSGHIHPGDLKTAVTEALNRILEPVRSHFASGEPKILLEKIKKFKVTR